MSHFVVYALVPPGTEDIEGYLDVALEPFSENIEVEEHEARCWCVGRAAQQASIAAVRRAEQFGLLESIDRLRDRFWALAEEVRSDELWEQWTQPARALQQSALRSHPQFDKPDPDCEDCGGSGLRRTTSNPRAKWDWWRVGGRWDGLIQGVVRLSSGGFNSGPDHERIENNSRPVEDLLAEEDEEVRTPFAVLTPDGEWHQSGAMGWWGIVSDEVEPSDWEAQVRQLYHRYRDCLAVAIDCHI